MFVTLNITKIVSHFTNVFIFLYFMQADTTYLRLADSIFHSISLFYFAYLATDEPGADYVWHLLSQVKKMHSPENVKRHRSLP